MGDTMMQTPFFGPNDPDGDRLAPGARIYPHECAVPPGTFKETPPLTPNETPCTNVCAQSPAPDGSLAADIDAFEEAELADAFEHFGSKEELARWQEEARARANRLRAALGIAAQSASPAPAWTREVPKAPGLFWCRPRRDGPLWKSWRDPERPGLGEVFEAYGPGKLRVWFHGRSAEESLDSFEWWPVPVEPPK